jgi:type III pantothenate kinase
MVSEVPLPSGDDAAPGAAPQVLAIDVGNSFVHVGAMQDGKAIRMVVLESGDPSELADAIEGLWAELDASEERAVVASSVSPEQLARVEAVVSNALGEDVIVIGQQIDLPIPVALEQPEAVGVDRVCAAAAAYGELKTACVVADFGTAITIDLVSDDGMFMGGTIAPGLRMSSESLETGTAALPRVHIVEPTHPWGRNTREAINNGIFYGAIGALREVVERYATETGRWLPLVVTGGACELIAKHAEFVDHVVPDLILRGIALAYQRARERQDDES